MPSKKREVYTDLEKEAAAKKNAKPDKNADPRVTSVDKPMAKFTPRRPTGLDVFIDTLNGLDLPDKEKARILNKLAPKDVEKLVNYTEPELEYTQKVVDSGVDTFQKRLLFGTITTGNIRMEWAAARYGMSIPANWATVSMLQYMSGYIPLRFSIVDGQNMIVQEAIAKGYSHLLLIEHDTCPPADALIRFNEYMRDGRYPVVSGLYFTKSEPAEPMIYRGRGSSYYTDWTLGDRILADGVPTGLVLIDCKLLKAVWDDSPQYMVNGAPVRRVFDAPIKTFFNEETGAQEALVGTTDLNFCKRIIEGGYLAKAGWPELQELKHPFIIDTRIAALQVDQSGVTYPIGGINHWAGVNGNWPEDSIVDVGVIAPELSELKQ